MNIAHLDFEVRSRQPLPEVGAFRYACDPSTEILMAGVARETGPVHLWVNPKFETPDMISDDEALTILREADLVYAHNAPFELAMWWAKALPGIRIKVDQWRCTAALARKAGLPSSLEQCAIALNLQQQKDPKGKKLIKLFCVPQDDGEFVDPLSRPQEWGEFGDYCRQDVRTEREIHAKLKAFDLTGLALEAFQFDLRMNLRGVPVNRKALENANAIIDFVQADVTKEFRELTGLNPTQREKIRQIVNLPNMQADTVAEALQGTTLDARDRKILTLYSKLSFAAIKKVPTMLAWACPDDRMRGVFTYHGAGTGRWTAQGPQVQNAKKPTEEMRKVTERAYQMVCDGCSADDLDLLFGDPLDVLASSVRHFIHAPGEEMLDGDYNAIEGRIACWIAGQTDILEDWRQGKDLYKRATAFVENIPEASVTRQGRDFGKVVELAAQFGLGTDGFMRTCANWGIECDEAKARRAVHEYYRPTHKKIVSRWYMLDDWMREAITHVGTRCGPFHCRHISGILFFFLTLPSGRSIAYPRPEIRRREPTAEEREEMKRGKNYPEKRFLEIVYWGQIQGNSWGYVKLHGAKAFENEVQAIAADVMAHGAITAEKREMPPFALIHDQGLAIRAKDKTAEDFAAALALLPPWAKGLPLKVEAKITPYYKK